MCVRCRYVSICEHILRLYPDKRRKKKATTPNDRVQHSSLSLFRLFPVASEGTIGHYCKHVPPGDPSKPRSCSPLWRAGKNRIVQGKQISGSMYKSSGANRRTGRAVDASLATGQPVAEHRRAGQTNGLTGAPATRDESSRERSGKHPNHFCYCIFFSETGTGAETPVGKTKSDIRDVGNETIRSGTCR